MRDTLKKINSNRINVTLLLIFTFNILLIACSSTSESDSPEKSNHLTGTIEIDGSSTVFPISEAAAEDFGKLPGMSKVRVNVGVSGTGGGFKRFTVGETDVSDASRPIKDKEKVQAQENGVEYTELKLGDDGLSVVVNKSNSFVECLTVEELKAIWEPSTKIKNWSQVRSGFPDVRLQRYGPDTDSGTFDFFTEEIVGESQSSTSDYIASADDNYLVKGVSSDKGSLGYFGYAYYIENKDKLKVLGVDNGNGCVTPATKTIADGSYTPLSRPLFIYINNKSLQREEVKEFIKFYLENGAQFISEVGYVALADSVYQENLKVLSNLTE